MSEEGGREHHFGQLEVLASFGSFTRTLLAAKDKQGPGSLGACRPGRRELSKPFQPPALGRCGVPRGSQVHPRAWGSSVLIKGLWGATDDPRGGACAPATPFLPSFSPATAGADPPGPFLALGGVGRLRPSINKHCRHHTRGRELRPRERSAGLEQAKSTELPGTQLLPVGVWICSLPHWGATKPVLGHDGLGGERRQGPPFVPDAPVMQRGLPRRRHRRAGKSGRVQGQAPLWTPGWSQAELGLSVLGSCPLGGGWSGAQTTSQVRV